MRPNPCEARIIELEAEVRDLKEMLVGYGRLASNTPPNTAMLLGAALSGGDALALAQQMAGPGEGEERPGTHCSVCGEPMKGEPRPCAVVTHGECAMDATKELRVGREADRQRKGRGA